MKSRLSAAKNSLDILEITFTEDLFIPRIGSPRPQDEASNSPNQVLFLLYLHASTLRWTPRSTPRVAPDTSGSKMMSSEERRQSTGDGLQTSTDALTYAVRISGWGCMWSLAWGKVRSPKTKHAVIGLFFRLLPELAADLLDPSSFANQVSGCFRFRRPLRVHSE